MEIKHKHNSTQEGFIWGSKIKGGMTDVFIYWLVIIVAIGLNGI